MRRGNGDGSIFKLSGKRRKPFAVRVTIGFADDGKQLYKYIGYYSNKTDAKKALTEYLVNPTKTNVPKYTLSEVFNAMIEKSKFSDGTVQQYRSGFNQLSDLHNKPIANITLEELEEIIEDHNPSAQARIKKTLANCYKHAIRYEYVTRNLADLIDVESQKAKEKTPFTIAEIDELWAADGLHRDIPIILLYTGLRISELLELKNENVNMTEKTIYIEKSKTPAGVRTIPIHEKILPLIVARFEQNKRHLITHNGRKLSYSTLLSSHWNSSHTIHETRHTFVTQISKCSKDDIAIKKIIGHAPGDITEHYTHRTMDELRQAMNQLEYK